MGDDNTTCFHSLMTKKRYSRQIALHENQHGDLLDDQEDIQNHLIVFYQALLGTRARGTGKLDHVVIREGNIISLS